MDNTKILFMVVENLHFLDSQNFLPMSLKSMPKSLDLSCKKGYYPHFVNKADNMNCVGTYPEPIYYGVECQVMRAHLLAWYDSKK
jgi:hypothetical protein